MRLFYPVTHRSEYNMDSSQPLTPRYQRRQPLQYARQLLPPPQHKPPQQPITGHRPLTHPQQHRPIHQPQQPIAPPAQTQPAQHRIHPQRQIHPRQHRQPQTLLQRRNPAPTPSPPSILDRMGGTPQHWLNHGHLSDRDDRQAAIQTHLQQKQCWKPS
ncbi:MAG: hypothetical protein VKK80_04460 [Prochlorothrix sp.]|nr:hypothetical protein [Prochlorothrix sp.]